MQLMFRYVLAMLGLCLLILGCGEFKPTAQYLQKYEWKDARTQQFISFNNDSTGVMLLMNRAGDFDTFYMNYHFEPDSALMQLDMVFSTLPLKGLNLYGVMEFIHRDTFVYYAEKGFPEMGEKYRPNRMDYVKAIPFIKHKKKQ
ncbi:MAG: hypothetical protein HC912_02750 [Saprospiraceae bacterium]|nr:hypothetical protein [Saprospiraceae bacterium]